MEGGRLFRGGQQDTTCGWTLLIVPSLTFFPHFPLKHEHFVWFHLLHRKITLSRRFIISVLQFCCWLDSPQDSTRCWDSSKNNFLDWPLAEGARTLSRYGAVHTGCRPNPEFKGWHQGLGWSCSCVGSTQSQTFKPGADSKFVQVRLWLAGIATRRWGWRSGWPQWISV